MVAQSGGWGWDISDIETAVRIRAFAFLEEETSKYEDRTIPWNALVEGFLWEDQPVSLAGPPGIWKPKILDLPISIRTAPPKAGRERPYADQIGKDGLLEYKYFGHGIPEHPDNVGLRSAMAHQVPLIFLLGVEPGTYLPEWPALIVDDDPASESFSVAFDDHLIPGPAANPVVDRVVEAKRAYVTTQRIQRLHQRSFRLRVLNAYRDHCAICRLRHRELLEASHILPDGHPKGEPIIPNGIALCKLHHGAYDKNIIGISPDLDVKIRLDILEEKDGPMLIHGLQGFQGARLTVPSGPHLRPDRDFLAERYEVFRRAG